MIRKEGEPALVFLVALSSGGGARLGLKWVGEKKSQENSKTKKIFGIFWTLIDLPISPPIRVWPVSVRSIKEQIACRHCPCSGDTCSSLYDYGVRCDRRNKGRFLSCFWGASSAAQLVSVQEMVIFFSLFPSTASFSSATHASFSSRLTCFRPPWPPDGSVPEQFHLLSSLYSPIPKVNSYQLEKVSPLSLRPSTTTKVLSVPLSLSLSLSLTNSTIPHFFCLPQFSPIAKDRRDPSCRLLAFIIRIA